MNEEKNDIVKELIPRYLVGETTSEEERRLLDWISLTEENERQYEAMKKVFNLSEKYYVNRVDETLDINIDQEWNHFINQINKREETPVRVLQSEKQPLSIWYKVAATLLILVVSGFIINYFTSRNTPTLYQTADNKLTVTLPDGSKVSLNRHSQLSYSVEFGEAKRTVELKGEAFFDVSHDATKPFIIHANSATIEVVGTSFNVRAYDVHKEVEVIVKTGMVKVLASEKEVILTAGQKGTYSESKHQLNSVTNQDINFLSWNTQKVVFEETELRTVIETLNKTYGVNITIAATEVPTSCVVTVTFDHQTLDAVLHVLETTLNLKYNINGNQIEITSTGC